MTINQIIGILKIYSLGELFHVLIHICKKMKQINKFKGKLEIMLNI